LIIKNINVLKLADEFSAAKINIKNIIYINNDDYTQADFIFSESVNLDLVKHIIESHDPSPTTPPMTFYQELLKLQKDKEELAATLDMVLTDILPNLFGGGIA